MSSIAQDNIQKNNTTKKNVVTNNNNIIFNLTSIIETCKKNNANFINQPLQILNMETPSLYVCQKELNFRKMVRQTIQEKHHIRIERVQD